MARGGGASLCMKIYNATSRMNAQPKPQRVRQQLVTQKVVTVAPSKSARRRARKRMVNENREVQAYKYIMPQPMGVSNGPSASVQRLNKGFRKALKSPNVSAEGLAFLKCAFAPPDFQASRINGVPDNFEGQSLVKKHRLIQATTFEANQDTYFILAPAPGIAYWWVSVAAGTPILETTEFVGVPYSDLQSLFGSDTTGKQAADIITKYRFVSNHFEMVPTTNAMSWTGTVQAFKIMLTTPLAQGAAAGDLLNLTGLQGCNNTNANQYTGPFNLGVYAGAYNQASTFEFQNIIENQPNLPRTLEVANGDFGQLRGAPYVPGLDNQFETMCVKVSGVGANTNDTAIIKTWACVEYIINPGSGLYEYTTFSPKDENAMAIYRKIIQELPVGVCYLDNANFWKRVLDIIRSISGGLSVLPGPYGLAAGGVNSIASAINQLTM